MISVVAVFKYLFSDFIMRKNIMCTSIPGDEIETDILFSFFPNFINKIIALIDVEFHKKVINRF